MTEIATKAVDVVGIYDVAFVIDGVNHIREVVEKDFKDIGISDFDLVYAHPGHV